MAHMIIQRRAGQCPKRRQAFREGGGTPGPSQEGIGAAGVNDSLHHRPVIRYSV